MAHVLDFILIEGPDGVGKTTFAKQLSQELAKLGKETIYEYEPTRKYDAGLKLRESFTSDVRLDDETLINLFNEDRLQHVQDIILAKSRSQITVMDRYYLSTIAMQANGSFIEASERGIIYKRLVQPSLIFFLNASFDECRARIMSNRGSFDNMEEYDYAKNVHNNYQRLMHGVDRSYWLDEQIPIIEIDTIAFRLDAELVNTVANAILTNEVNNVRAIFTKEI